MISLKEYSNYFKVSIDNEDGYPDWIKDLNNLCIPINDEGKEKVLELAKSLEAEQIPYKILSFEKSNENSGVSTTGIKKS